LKSTKRKLKVLLINLPLREQYPPYNLPYGMGYVAKFLIKAGHKVELFDVDDLRLNREQVLTKLKQYKCDVIGTGGIITVYKYLKWLMPHLRELHPKAKIVIGGSLSTSSPEATLKYLKPDFIVVGEGEITTPELMDNINRSEKQLEKIEGIGFLRKGKPFLTKTRPMIKELDKVGYPDWNLFSIENKLRIRNKSMPLITERGCPFHCRYCYHQFGFKHRRISMEITIREMKYFKKKYNVTKFTFDDNLFVFDKAELRKMIRLLKKNKLKITFETSMRASLVTEELMQLLKEAGCVGLNFGFESGSRKVLNSMAKATTVAQMDNAVRILRKMKLKLHPTFMIGYPGETIEDIDQTIEFCKRNGILAKPFFTTPYPGTPLFFDIKDKIKDMDKFLTSLGDARDLVINISELSNKELIKQRRRVVEETEKAYLKHHKLLGLLFSPLRLLNIEVGFAVQEFVENSFGTFLKSSFKILLSYISGNRIVPATDDGYNKTYNN